MTDRISGVFVTFDRDIREDDVQPIIEAIGMIRHVVKVERHVANFDITIAKNRLRYELLDNLINLVNGPENET